MATRKSLESLQTEVLEILCPMHSYGMYKPRWKHYIPFKLAF